MAEIEEVADLLARVPMFSELAPEDLHELAQVAVPRSWHAGEAIFREGDAGDTCFIIRSGSVKVTRARAGRTIALAELHAGDMFGELAMFGGERRSATVEAIEDTTAVALLAPDVRRIVIQKPEIALRWLGALADRVRSANERVTKQSFQTVASRVAGALLDQAEARRAAGDADSEVVINATQTDIAQLAGASRESASRFLATLEREGLVTTGRGKVTVHDAEALRNYIY